MARVAMAMSGGVDSSVAAALLKKQGHEVIGIHMKLFRGQINESRQKSCCSYDETIDAQKICYKLGIPFYAIDYTEEFRKLVINYFVREYSKGLTPNPCVMCNTKIKNDLLLKTINEIDCDYLATGHYARISYDKDGNIQLARARDLLKDQTYFLYGINRFEMQRLKFPLENKTKKYVRNLANKLNLNTANKPDSQEICFVEKNYRDFLKKEIKNPPLPGKFVGLSGEILGDHNGIPFYTVGQRRGLKINHESPLYVVKIDAEDNKIILGSEKDLFSQETMVSNVNWVSISPPKRPMDVTAKIRYAHQGVKAKILPQSNNRIQLIFDKPERAITPGQSAVFYHDDILLGGGNICKGL